MSAGEYDFDTMIYADTLIHIVDCTISVKEKKQDAG